DPEEDHPRLLPISVGSSRAHRNRQFVSASEYLDTVTLGPDGSDVAITTRGKAFSFAHWEGPVRQHGEPDGVRYRHLTYLIDHKRLIAAAGDESPQERLVVLTADGSAPPRILDLDVGRVNELVPAPYLAPAEPTGEAAQAEAEPKASVGASTSEESADGEPQASAAEKTAEADQESVGG